LSITAAVTLAVSIAAIGAATAKKRPTERVGTIAFVSDRTGEDEIHLLHLSSMKSERLTRNPHGPDRAPAWSPDGEALAFNSRRKPDLSQPDIYLVRIASGAVERVTQSPLEDQRAAWTQDGRFIVYQRGDFATGFEVWRANLETGREKRLTRSDGSASFDVAPDPSPVSDLLLLQTNRGADGLFPFQIGLLEPGSKTPTIVPLKLKVSVDGPRWSPDGRNVAFAADGEIYVMSVATRRLRRLTDDRHQDLSPDWSPDGDAIVFQSDRQVRTGGLHVIDLKTRAVTFLREGRTPVWTRAEHERAGR